ncbi:MAG: hypothetical protein AAGG68_14765 [Bacteroidota bacterium]
MRKKIYEQILKNGTLRFGATAGAMVFAKLDSFLPRRPDELTIEELNFTSEELRQIGESLKKK